MKNFVNVPLVRILGVIALAAVVMFGMVACGDDDDNGGGGGNSAFNGTWTNEADPDDKITITGTNWTRTSKHQI